MSILFQDFQIRTSTKEALAALGFDVPTPIQEKAIPVILEGLDIIGQAQTGTGKTFAYAIPMVERIDPKVNKIQGLILTPTRELSMQVYKEILKLIKFYPSLKATTIVGGESYDRQFRALSQNPHIIVGTPGRIIDHINRATVDFSHLSMLALDEADEMLKMGFQEDLETILKTTPTSRQTVLFSATMPPFIKKIAKVYQKDPQSIKIEAESLTVENIEQSYFIVKDDDKAKLLKRLIDLENPKSAIIFCNTKADVDRIALALQDERYNVDSLHGDLKQSQRNYVMSRFRNKQLAILIATDVAARGLDVSDVEVVINYDLPQQDEVYVHRIGRTGRAGKKGKAYSFVTPRKQRNLKMLEVFTGKEIKKLAIPDQDAIYLERLKRFKHDLKISIKKEVPNHVLLLSDFINDEETLKQLINHLLDNSMPKMKTYDDIEVIQDKKDRNRREERAMPGQSGRTGYDTFMITLGRKDGLNPQGLFKVLEKEYGIYSKHVGDIKHMNNETIFDLKKDTAHRLKLGKVFKHQGKNVKVSAYHKK
ncbi:DEAD/DEAH box helicase [Acholeplasma equirhinis]|uniref:DEAD/DEAH box helicase n=1 Tax=Acholeplasma equirhinis TaxID=555393 RepID=UPI00197ACBD1|nr:DEAD/DEAH box helicase [Acholeplasma equirhinis]MBN3490091.1 DEAD/DEAH box helicase [Acholeplasma equirhinis]